MTENTLRELLEKFKFIDDDLPPEDFKPEELVGDIRDKVDSIKFKLDEWRAKADAIKKEWVSKLQVKAQSLEKKADRLELYVYEQMVHHNFETLPGTLVRIDLQNSPSSVEIEMPANPDMYLQYSNYMAAETDYRWDKKAIKAALEAGKELPWAHLRQNRHVRFYPRKG